MAPEEVVDILKAAFGEVVLESKMDSGHPYVVVEADRWREVAAFLRDDGRLRFNLLRCISGVDRLADGQIEVVYDLLAIRPPREGTLWVADSEIAIKVRVPRDGGHVSTVSDLWPAADWHERETYDLLGVTFDGHPDHRRILCPDDWVGHPLRKDYEFPREYHGIPASTEFDQTSPRH